MLVGSKYNFKKNLNNYLINLFIYLFIYYYRDTPKPLLFSALAECVSARVHVRARVCACIRKDVRARVCACIRKCVRVGRWGWGVVVQGWCARLPASLLYGYFVS